MPRLLALGVVCALAALAAAPLLAVRADTAANCTYADFLGTWAYKLSAKPSWNKFVNCSLATFDGPVNKVTLSEPNVATDADGHRGNWTLIYNQGVEVWLNESIWFAFSVSNGTQSFCNLAGPGWVHPQWDSISGEDWNCFMAVKIEDDEAATEGRVEEDVDSAAAGEAALLDASFEQMTGAAAAALRSALQAAVPRAAARAPATSSFYLALYSSDNPSCDASLGATNVDFVPSRCTANLPPQLKLTGRAGIIVNVNNITNEWELQTYSDESCTALTDSLFGRGFACNSDLWGLAFQLYTPVVGGENRFEMLTYDGDDCTGAVTNGYGIQDEECFPAFDPTARASSYLLVLGQRFTLYSFLDRACQVLNVSVSGAVSTCANGIMLQPGQAAQAEGAAEPELEEQQEEEAAPAPASRSALDDVREQRMRDPVRLAQLYRADHSYLAQVNAAQDWFAVKAYPQFEGLTIGGLERMRGSTNLASPLRELHARDPPLRSRRTASSAALPASWDWRNVSGQNFVSPVRDQGQCGSCYAFGSCAMMEARIRIRSNNRLQPILSTQDIVSCSPYSQGCEGGFPYLVAGKYGRDFGLLEEQCYPYAGADSACNPPAPTAGCDPKRWETAEYFYIGGYYGQSTVELMQEEILANGPIAVSFEVYDDLMHYAGGVYSHKFTKHLRDSYNPFELTNHVVSIVGWGVTDAPASTPYWIVKNSWGEAWGENGYFRILRGSSEAGGECAIESITVSAIPILH